MLGLGLTSACFVGTLVLPKDYVPINVMGMVVGVLLLQGGV